MAKRDWLRECNDQNVPPQEFHQIFCVRCRNSDCTRAGYSVSLFADRVSTQVERLLINPQFADLTLPQYAKINANDFPDAVRHALRIELANKRKDWEIPPEDLDIGAAMAELAGAVPVKATPPRHEGLEITVVEEAEIHGETRDATQVVAPQPPPEPVRPDVTETTKQPVLIQRTNTAFPVGGVMIDGSKPPTRKEPPKLAVPVDPWAVPAPVENVVPVGAKIRLGLAMADSATKKEGP